MNNFVKRALSGAVFVALIVSSILLNEFFFYFIFALVCSFALYEFHQLTNNKKQICVNLFSAIIGGLFFFSISFFVASDRAPFTAFLLYGIFLLFVFIAELYRKKENPINNLAYFLLGQIYIVFPFSILNFILFISGYQPLLLLALFVCIWASDTGAYLVGVMFGKHRLFERISPKKSWEGFLGGVVFALACGYLFSYLIPQVDLMQSLFFALIVVVVGAYGDLTESLFKRTLNVKDSSNMIPGHGGFLDRFDSMLLAAPAVFFFLKLTL